MQHNCGVQMYTFNSLVVYEYYLLEYENLLFSFLNVTQMPASWMGNPTHKDNSGMMDVNRYVSVMMEQQDTTPVDQGNSTT